MNYITNIILENLVERFHNDKSYLAEKKEELEKYESKFEALEYLFFKCDSQTQKFVAEKLNENGNWNLEKEELQELFKAAYKFLRMV